MNLYNHIEKILECPIHTHKGIVIGHSLLGKELTAYKYGAGTKHISLIAGNHADEPVGPLLLKKLVTYLASLPHTNPLLQNYSWYIVPHGNPDGEAINKAWYSYLDQQTDLTTYLMHVQRELPGKDVEFGFPIAKTIQSLRPENEAIYNFWKTANTPFELHVSLHGMQATYGPWFLIDENWIDRTETLRKKCKQQTTSLGYELYDLDRKSEKGFQRIEEGFCTRPDSKAMRKHFLALNDTETAKKFHASSMESIRSLGGDCLTLVSEMPLFLYPKQERQLQWPDPFLQKWSQQFQQWKLLLKNDNYTKEQCNAEAKKLGVQSMLWNDQMKLQWQMITAGIETIS